MHSTSMLEINKARGVRDKNIILSLDPLKVAVSNSIPIILKLFSSDISSHLTKLFNFFFSYSVFPNPKIQSFPYLKKSKFKCSNHHPISLLSNIDKILERVMHNYLYEFLQSKNLVQCEILISALCFPCTDPPYRQAKRPTWQKKLQLWNICLLSESI